MASKMISNVSKIVHEKVSYSGPFKPFKYRCDNDLNALTVNKDFTQVVVAGRAVFKVLNIKEDCFTDVVNLRTNKSKQDPVYCISDVTWHHQDENLLASAATNGSVVVWSINTRKQELVYNDHKRSVNRVTFHGSEHNQLLSASQDGVVMIHDIRQQNVCINFGTPGNESVKDAQFCPPNMGYFTFAAAYGNSVQIWDMRRPDKFERHFMAHNGPVYTLDWHPTDRNTLATAGRDKMIKVWDLSMTSSQSNRSNLYSITNIAPVAHIKWRPGRKAHIASCSLQLDNSINVWDVNRPYIPFARFEGHDNTATWVKWREDCHVFLTCGKDGNVIQHVFEDAKRPADDVNLAAIDISINFLVGYVNSEKNDNNYKSKKVSRSRQFTTVQSSLSVFEHYNSVDDEKDPSNSLFLTEEQQFVQMAQQYQLDGSSFVDLCLHNSNVAKTFQNDEVADSWRLVATLLSPSLNANTHHHVSRTASLSMPIVEQEYPGCKELSIKSALKQPKEKIKSGLTQISDHMDGETGSNDESSEVDGENSEVDKSLRDLTITPTSVLFGEGGMDGNSRVWYNATGMLDHSHYNHESIHTIPNEAFRVRHELKAMTGLRPMVMEEYDVAHVTLDAESHYSIANNTTASTNTNYAGDLHETSEQTSLIIKSDAIALPDQMDFTDVVTSMIKNYAEKGDVQTVVTMLIVIGDAIQPSLNEAYQESWFFAYIDLLGQFELWKEANDVIKHSKLVGVCSMNQESTIIHTFCTMCSRPMERSAWLCDKCKRVTNQCSLCHYPVKGCMAWCQGCGHGGHKEHIKSWLEISSMCPAGCGHQCEFV